MRKLKTMSARVKPMTPRIGYAEGDVKGQDKARNRAAHWREWYGTREWRELRLAAFARDGFICQRTGQLCMGKHPAPDSPVANHKRPHRGNRKLFFDLDNLETIAKHIHDKEVQREEQGIPQGVWD